MKAPISGYGKDYAVKWLNVGNDEIMYSGAMTKEEAKRLVVHGHWHSRACPVVVTLAKERAREGK